MSDDHTPLPPNEAEESALDAPNAEGAPPEGPLVEDARPDVVEPPVPPVTPVTPVTAVTPAPEVAPRRRSGAIWWGIALVFLGATLLVSQFVPGVQAWRYWPLIIVAVGLRQMFGPSRGAWSIRHLGEGLSTVAIGLVLLGQMIGYLQWNVWLNILRLWPLLLVSLGLEVIGKALRSEFVRFLGSVIIVAGLAYGALVMTQTAGFPFPFVGVGDSESFSLSASNESDVERGEATIDGGVGTLTVEAGSDLVTADGATPFEPVFDVTATGDEAVIRVGLGEGVWAPTEPETRLDVTLDEGVAWDLDVDAGVSRFEIDLSDLDIEGLVLNAGVSDGTLTLGAPEGGESVSVEIDSGVSSLTIRVPRGESARLTVDGGLSGVDTEGDWTSDRDGERRVYESDGFSDSGAYWDIRIDAGVSGITIEYY